MSWPPSSLLRDRLRRAVAVVGRFKMGGHRNVCGEVIVDIGVQVSGIDVGSAEAGDCLMRRVGQCETDCVGTRLSKTEIGLESFGLTVTICERSVWDIFQQKLAGCGDDGAVVVLRAIDRAGGNVRRDDHRGNSNTETREVKCRIERIGVT